MPLRGAGRQRWQTTGTVVPRPLADGLGFRRLRLMRAPASSAAFCGAGSACRPPIWWDGAASAAPLPTLNPAAALAALAGPHHSVSACSGPKACPRLTESAGRSLVGWVNPVPLGSVVGPDRASRSRLRNGRPRRSCPLRSEAVQARRRWKLALNTSRSMPLNRKLIPTSSPSTPISASGFIVRISRPRIRVTMPLVRPQPQPLI